MAYTTTENPALDAVDDIMTARTKDDLFKLGLIYSTDAEERGPDYVQAHKWFSLAAMMGSLPAKAYRDEIKFELSASDLTLAQKAARGWLAENRSHLAA